MNDAVIPKLAQRGAATDTSVVVLRSSQLQYVYPCIVCVSVVLTFIDSSFRFSRSPLAARATQGDGLAV